MKKTLKTILSMALAFAMFAAYLPAMTFEAFADDEDATAIETAADSTDAESESAAGDVYVLMNIPYDEFYGAENASVADVDAVTSATGKTGNYGKAGGAFHSGTTASTAADGTVTAVGGDKDSKVQGVIWPVKFASADEAKALGGEAVKDDDIVITATQGKGKTSSQTLRGYEVLTERPAYSYYVLSGEPAFYAEYKNGTFTGVEGKAVFVKGASASTQYGTNWGDVQIELSDISDTADKLISAMVFTTADGNKVGLYHLDQIWANNSIGWKVDATPGLDGKTITNIRYYCSVKDADVNDSEVPEYANYVYDYPVSVDISQVFTGKLSAVISAANTITVSGLPKDAKNVSAKVYWKSEGRNATYEYLTPMEVDPADDDIDPAFVKVNNGKITFAAGSVTNKKGETKSFGDPEEGKTYTIELASDNYIIRKASVVYTAPKAKSKATVKVSPLKKTYKVKTLKKKAKKFQLKATVSSGAKATFKKVSGNKKITVSKTGKVTVKKKLKKGTYKVKVKVTAPETDDALAASKTVTVVVKVKK